MSKLQRGVYHQKAAFVASDALPPELIENILAARKDPPLLLCKHVFQRPFAKTPKGYVTLWNRGHSVHALMFPYVSLMYIDTFS